ncbi:MAG: catalase [Clostridiales bacterium]|nr:catalase [Clostridiales bacterium]
MTLKKIIGHFKTITRHRHTVIAHSRLAGILFQGLRHDLSKYSPTEFIPGARFYCGDRSPNEEERALYGYSAAWLHHKGRNRHHFEYWSDYNVKTKEFGPVPMPPKYIAEMFCDRVAASKIYQGKKYTDKHPLEYFMRSKGRRPIDPNTSDMIEGLLRTLAEDGEDAAFAAVRKMLKESKSAR